MLYEEREGTDGPGKYHAPLRFELGLGAPYLPAYFVFLLMNPVIDESMSGAGEIWDIYKKAPDAYLVFLEQFEVYVNIFEWRYSKQYLSASLLTLSKHSSPYFTLAIFV